MDLLSIDNEELLRQISSFVTQKKKNQSVVSNVKDVLAFAGNITASELNSFDETVATEFNRIEGEW